MIAYTTTSVVNQAPGFVDVWVVRASITETSARMDLKLIRHAGSPIL